MADLRNGAVPEHLPHHGGVSEDALLLGGKSVEARRHHSLHGDRHRRTADLVCEQAGRFLRKERVARAALDDVGDLLTQGVRIADKAGNQATCVLRRQPVQGDTVHLGAPRGEGRMLFEQLRACGADDEKRHRIDVCRQMFDEGEQAVVGPMKVLQHNDQRLFESQLFDEAQPGGEVLLALGLRRLETEERPQAVGHPGAVGPVGHDDVQLRRHRRRIVGLENAGMRLDDLRERPEAHPLTVG